MPSFVRAHLPFSDRLHAHGGEGMERGEELKVEDAIKVVAVLLAAAYRRRAKLRLIPIAARSSIKGLDNTGEESVHELTLTGQRKESLEP